MNGIALWITGLPGSGKSAYADRLKEKDPGLVLLRMDELRKVVTPSPTFSEEERETVYRSLIYTAKTLTEAGRDVIIDATGNMRRWRQLARDIIRGYGEVYLRCPLEVCIKRESERKDTRGAPGAVYEKGRKGWPVPGMGAPYEEPLNPEITIDTDSVPIEEGIKGIVDIINKLRRNF
jgi:adenylylsulfate kinase